VIVFALSTGHMIGLGLVALAWIVFALLASFVLPRGRDSFPKNVGAFLALCAVFFIAMLAAVFVFGKESKESEAAPATPVLTQTGVTETSGSATTPAPSGTTGGASPADLAAGKTVFEKAACGGCHILKDANGTGQVGPDLDTLKPDMATVEHQVTNGGGAMPAYKGTLSNDEITAVAAYVSQVAGTS
jgi:cytochrome c6